MKQTSEPKPKESHSFLSCIRNTLVCLVWRRGEEGKGKRGRRMSKKEIIKKELVELAKEGVGISEKFRTKKGSEFKLQYQIWYSKALKVVEYLAPDRLIEFRGYYESDHKRKNIDYANYTIQDYMRNIEEWGVEKEEVANLCFLNQIAILSSLQSRIDSLLSNLETELYSELQDNGVSTAKQLAKINLRSAGALMGVIIEGHLQKIAEAHNVKISKKYPTISELNDLLKKESIVDPISWRKISHFAEIRNCCVHEKGNEPTKEQIQELIQGTEWLIENVF